MCQRDESVEEDSRQREGPVRTSGCNTAEPVQAVPDLGGRRGWRLRGVEGAAPRGCLTEGPERLVEDD